MLTLLPLALSTATAPVELEPDAGDNESSHPNGKEPPGRAYEPE